MSKLHIIDEHHELVTSLGVLLRDNSNANLLSNTVLHFDSHSDVGDIKTPIPLDPEFKPIHSDLLRQLNVGNPFTLLFYYGLISDFYWFAPDEVCQEICQPFVFSVEHKWDNPVHFYRRQLTSCLDSIFESRKLNLPTYRKISIDSDENLSFLWHSFDYALIDTGLRDVICGQRGFILDICYDYFCVNPDHIASPMTISITEQYYNDFLADPLHPLKLRLGPIARVTRDENGFQLDIGGFTPNGSCQFSESGGDIETIDSRLLYLEKFLRSLKSPPLSIYLCRSRISNYTPKSYIGYIEHKLLELIDSLDFV